MLTKNSDQRVGRPAWRLQWLFVLSATVALFSSGCCVNRGACTSCSGGGGGDPWVINDGGMFDPAHGGCDTCGEAGCGGHRPLSLVRKALTCGAGCSNEIYVDEWLSDPPDCCDPCNNCGDWVGPRACSPTFSPLSWCNLFGIRHDRGCGGGSCASCGSEGYIEGNGYYEGEVIEGPLRVIDDKPVPATGKASPKPAPKGQPMPPRDTGAHRHSKRPYRLTGVQPHTH